MPSTESTSSSDESAQPVNTRTSLSKSRPLQAKASRSLDHDPSSSSSGQSSSDSESDEGREDTQVLSHAERRRQKKKDAKSSAGSKGNNRETHNKVPPDASASKQPKRQNSVWVGNLSFKTSADSLRRFFDGVGEITRIHMPTKVANAGPSSRGNAKENLGFVLNLVRLRIVSHNISWANRFAYVDFASPDAKVVAITMSENPLDGRRLLIKDGTFWNNRKGSFEIYDKVLGGDYTGRPTKPAAPANEDDSSVTKSKTSGTGTTKTAQKILRSQKQPPGPTLFFGNLGFETTEASIREMLEHHHKDRSSSAEEGEKWIRKIRMGTFEDSGKCKGYVVLSLCILIASRSLMGLSR